MNTTTFDRRGYSALIGLLRAIGLPTFPLDESVNASNVTNIRHDIDLNLPASVAMAEFEKELEIRSTYFVLNTADYWADKVLLREGISRIISAGHYIGWHNDALSEHFRTDKKLKDCISEPLDELRTMANVTGTASHGSSECHVHGFLNYSVFKGTKFNPNFPFIPNDQFDLSEFGLKYEAYHTGNTHYLSDSHGRWSKDIEGLTTDINDRIDRMRIVKLQVLVHPEWWSL